MDPNGMFTTLLCNLISHTLHVTSSQLVDITPGNVNNSTVFKTGEIVQAASFPFENTKEELYSLETFHYDSNRIPGKAFEVEFPESVEKEEDSAYKKQGDEADGELKEEKVDGEQNILYHTEREDSLFIDLVEVLNQVTEINNQINKLKMLSKLVKAELREIKKALVCDSFKNLLNILDKKISRNLKKMKKINNLTEKIQYQMENIFMFNRLLNEKNVELEGEVFKELTVRKMKEVLEKAVNNLVEEGTLVGEPVPVGLEEIDLLQQLQRNFSKIFNHQNVTLNHINQMSKIIDFVERYHGTPSNLKTLLPEVKDEEKEWSEWEIADKEDIKLQTHEKMVNNEFDAYKSVEATENRNSRRKGA